MTDSTPNEPTPTYGLTQRTRKPVAIAAQEFLRAINGLDVHDRDERSSLPDAVAAVIKKDGLDQIIAGETIQNHVARLEETAARHRLERGDLLDRLRTLRDPLIDVISEAQTLLPESAMRSRYIDPPTLATAPTPLTGRDFPADQLLRLLTQALAWTQETSRYCVVEALGPCYLLTYVVEHHTDEAMSIRKSLEEAASDLKRFVQRR